MEVSHCKRLSGLGRSQKTGYCRLPQHIPEPLAASVQAKPWPALHRGAKFNASLAIVVEGNST